MNERFDVIVAGLGAMGSLTACALAREGRRVLGFDRFAPPHAMGSSHGHSRIIREAYFEDPRYVPLVHRAYERWAALEIETNRTLFRQTGGLMLGRPEGALVRGARLSAELHRLPHDILSAEDVRQRFPAFRPDDDMVGVFEPRAGILSPEACIGAALEVARARGAILHDHESLIAFEDHADGVTVTTTRARYECTSLVVAVGAWTRDLLRELSLPLVVQRNVQFWFTPVRHSEQFTAERLPIFICECAPKDGRPDAAWYGFPDVGDGLKLAIHHHGDAVDPQTIERSVAVGEEDVVREILAQYMPDANGPLIESAVCMYTNAPDEHFILGRHPDHPSVVVASPCSGHGFKFASVIGELLADLALGREPTFDLSLFDPRRFRAATQ